LPRVLKIVVWSDFTAQFGKSGRMGKTVRFKICAQTPEKKELGVAEPAEL